MRISRRRGKAALVGLAALVVAASTGLTAAASPRQADPLQDQVDAVHATGVVGVSAEVWGPGTRDSARAGTSVAGTGLPMPRDGRFRIGSATKTFTATVVLQLVGEGRLSLDDTVERWLPGVVQGNGNDGRAVTVRDLLQHTSGIHEVVPDIPALTGADGYRAERFRSYTPEEVVGLAMRYPPPDDFTPGEDWSYSNTNYTLAAMIVEKVTGHSWEREVGDRIIRPLGLRDTSTPGTFPFILGPHARSYTGFGMDTGTDTDVTVLNASMAVGAGALISTAHDLNRFYTALFSGDLLAPAQLAAMTDTVDAPGLGARYGLGIGEIPLSCGGSYYGHPGELLGYRTWAGATPDGSRSAVVYVTSDGGEATQEAMSALVDQALCGTSGDG